MTSGDAEGMREFWDARAKENAAWYVDTSLSYDDPDMVQFWETGKTIVREALVDAPVQPERRELAVEIGSGLGRICLALRDHFDRVVGLDISASMVEQARQHVTASGVEFHVSDGASLRPVENGSADFVTTFTVLQHQSSKDLVLGILRDASRVLRTGGVLAAQWNNTDPLKFRWTRLKLALRRALGRGQPDTTGAPQYLGTAVRRADVQRALEAAGLEVVGFKGEGTLFCWVWARKP
jgi:ubiquinone/menaquinone biosynthesis C-methylase UbiE